MIELKIANGRISFEIMEENMEQVVQVRTSNAKCQMYLSKPVDNPYL